MDAHGKTAVAEDLDHAVVLGHHVGLEDGDAGRRGGLRQLAKQDGAQAVSLDGVGHRERDLGTSGTGGWVEAVPDYDLRLPVQRQEAETLPVVHVEEGRGQRGHLLDCVEEPEDLRLLGEARQEARQRILVGRHGRAQGDGGAGAQYHVDVVSARISPSALRRPQGSFTASTTPACAECDLVTKGPWSPRTRVHWPSRSSAPKLG